MNNRPTVMPKLPSRDDVAAGANHAAREAVPWVEGLGRLGYAAHGAVYATVGLLAGQAAFGVGGAATDPDGVFNWILESTFGGILLALIACGLIGYALWRFVQGARDTERKGTSPSGLAARAGFAGSGIAHLGLGVSAMQLGLGTRGPSDDTMVPDRTAQLLNVPFGEFLVVLAGVAVVSVAVGQALLAFRSNFRRHLKTEEMDPDLVCWIVRLGRLGYAARAFTFALVGTFLIRAALDRDPGQAHGLGGSLSVLASQPHGSALLALAALGLIAYGAFELAESRFRRMQAP